jgi:hypothetical protein
MIQGGEIGAVHRTIADLSSYYGETWDATHRMVNKELAGGAMLDCASGPPAVPRVLFCSLALTNPVPPQWVCTP